MTTGASAPVAARLIYALYMSITDVPALSRAERILAHAEGSISEDEIVAAARERALDAGAGATGPIGRRRLAADRAEPDHDQDVQLGVCNVTFDGTRTIEIAPIRYSPI